MLPTMTYSFPEDFDFRPVSPDDVPGIASQLVSIWIADNPSEHEQHGAHREQIILRQAHCLGFRCFTASSSDVIVGFSYGMYHGEGTGQLGGNIRSRGTHDHLQEQGFTDPEWRDSFDIGELQVLAKHREHHIGEGLLRLLCEGLPPGRVVLSVDKRAFRAIRLYTEKLQFQEVFPYQTVSFSARQYRDESHLAAS
jgi:ribosomal protein S18 acetylase RimI-like enzyme